MSAKSNTTTNTIANDLIPLGMQSNNVDNACTVDISLNISVTKEKVSAIKSHFQNNSYKATHDSKYK